jgi:hypothetical protein
MLARASRVVVFGTLAVLALGFALAGQVAGGRTFDDAWTQLFWLTVGILVTSFVIQSLLSHDAEARRRREDSFAFRTFTGAMLDQLSGIVGAAPAPQASVMAAAIGSAEEFAAKAADAGRGVRAAGAVDADAYLRGYLDIASGLRNLAVGHTRTFSSSRQQMVDSYGRLMALAARWDYRDELSSRFRKDTATLADPAREQETRQAAAAALEVVRDTAAYLAELAGRATRPGMPAVPTPS